MRHLMPDYWLQNHTYSKAWDRKLNELLDKYDFTNIGSYTAMLGDTAIWISNHPYASFTPYGRDVRPRRKTILRAWRKLESTY